MRIWVFMFLFFSSYSWAGIWPQYEAEKIFTNLIADCEEVIDPDKTRECANLNVNLLESETKSKVYEAELILDLDKKTEYKSTLKNNLKEALGEWNIFTNSYCELKNSGGFPDKKDEKLIIDLCKVQSSTLINSFLDKFISFQKEKLLAQFESSVHHSKYYEASYKLLKHKDHIDCAVHKALPTCIYDELKKIKLKRISNKEEFVRGLRWISKESETEANVAIEQFDLFEKVMDSSSNFISNFCVLVNPNHIDNSYLELECTRDGYKFFDLLLEIWNDNHHWGFE
ncbi:hypothetical protein KNO30_04690 [Taylorella equigenitalis]|nr:hypothetical protein KNO30_04690 [Taylorella equigenitalis]